MNSTNKVFQIKEITAFYKPYSFPQQIVSKDLMAYFDLIFNKTAELPKKDHLLNKESLEKSEKDLNYFQHLIFDEKYKKVSINNSRGTWKSNEGEQSEFFDNFKGKCSQNEVKIFRKSFEMTNNSAVNIIISGNRLFDLVEIPGLKASLQNDGVAAEEYFTSFEELGIKKGNVLKIPVVDCVYRVNERINYPRNKPLWYVYHAEADSSYGPLSSEDIEQMVNSKLLDPESKIRLIDTFIYKGSKQFEFFALKEVQLENFIDNIAVSSLIYNMKISNKNVLRRDLNESVDSHGKSHSHKNNSQPQTTIYSATSTSLYEAVGGSQERNVGQVVVKQNENYGSGSYSHTNPHKNNFDEDQKNYKNFYQNNTYYNNNNYNYYGSEDFNNTNNNNNKYNKQKNNNTNNRGNYNNYNNNRQQQIGGGKSLY